MPGCGAGQVPEEGDPEGLGEEDCEEVAREGVHKGGKLQPHNADEILSGRGSQGCDHRGCASVEGQEGDRRQGDQGQVRGQVQGWEEQVVLFQAQVLISHFLFLLLFYLKKKIVLLSGIGFVRKCRILFLHI